MSEIENKIKENLTTEEEIKLMEELANKHRYIVFKDNSMTEEEKEKNDSYKVIKEEKLEDIIKILEGDSLQIEYSFGKDRNEFDNNNALIYLLLNEVVFLNNHWWEEEWCERAKKTTSLNVNCNDVFAWGCADAEEIEVKEIKEIYEYYKKDPEWGVAIWCIKKRNMLPQKPVYDIIQKIGKWDLNTMNLEKNYDEY